jgi:predicted Zn-dependent peptidase
LADAGAPEAFHYHKSTRLRCKGAARFFGARARTEKTSPCAGPSYKSRMMDLARRLSLRALGRVLAGALLLFTTAAAPPAGAAPSRDPFALTAESYTLPSGMNVLLRRDPSVPRVVVSLWFDVGSRDEAPGKTGFAHLYEHLMFMGTHNVPNGQFDQIMETQGGANNATTSNDRTFYYDFGPSHILPTLLWLEAERLVSLPEAMTDEKVGLQREVVRNERRQSYENRPYGSAELRLIEAMFPKGHPYSWPVIGSHQDLIAATTADVKQFFYTYYAPSNATLAVVGDFDPAQARKLIQSYFGWMPKRPKPAPVAAPKPLTAPVETQVVVHDRVALPRLYLGWHAPSVRSDELAEAQLVADVLARGKASRLYRSLVVEQKLAQSVEVDLEPLSFGSLMVVAVTANAGVVVEALAAAVQRELGRLVAQPPGPEELARARSQRLTDLAGEIETPLGQAAWLQQMQAWYGDAGALPKLVRRLRDVTPARLLARAQAMGIADASRRLTLSVLPGDKALDAPQGDDDDEEAAQGKARPRAAVAVPVPPVWPKSPLDLSKAPALWKERPIVPPKTARASVGGMDVLLLQRKATPLIELVVTLPSGETSSPPDQAGLAAAVAAMLTEGAGQRSATQVAEALGALGAQVRQTVSSDTTQITLSVMAENFPAAAAILGDVLLRPRLAEEDWKRVRDERLALLMQQREEPAALAERALRAHLFGESHPLGRVPIGDEPSLRRIDVAGLRFFHKTHYHPSRFHVVLAGDIELSEASASQLLKPLVLSPLPPAPPVTPVVLGQPAPFQGLVLVDRPGAPQAEVQVANLIPGRRDAERVPAEVANALLGGMFTSRLNQNLREKNGYTYGARSLLTRMEGTGWFVARAAVRTDVTANSLAEINKELGRLRDEPVRDEELRKGKNAAVQRLVAMSERTAGLAQFYGELLRFGLPLDELSRFWREVGAVTPASLKAVVRDRILPGASGSTLVIVGDRAKVLPGLKQLLPAKESIKDYAPRP